MEGPKSFEGLRRRHAYVVGGGDGCEGILRVVSAAQRQDERSQVHPLMMHSRGLAFLGTINQAPGRSGVLCRGRGRGPQGDPGGPATPGQYLLDGIFPFGVDHLADARDGAKE